MDKEFFYVISYLGNLRNLPLGKSLFRWRLRCHSNTSITCCTPHRQRIPLPAGAKRHRATTAKSHQVRALCSFRYPFSSVTTKNEWSTAFADPIPRRGWRPRHIVVIHSSNSDGSNSAGTYQKLQTSWTDSSSPPLPILRPHLRDQYWRLNHDYAWQTRNGIFPNFRFKGSIKS